MIKKLRYSFCCSGKSLSLVFVVQLIQQSVLTPIIVVITDRNDLGLNADELTFYDALTKPQAVKDFYKNDELISIRKELTEKFRKSAL